MENKIYDIAVVGGGPGGLTAAIYAIRSGRSVVLIEKGMIGGQIALTNEVTNYPGYASITGFDLSMKMHEQAQGLGAEFIYDEVNSVNLTEKIKTITTTSSGTVSAKAVIISTGARARQLELEHETELLGRGVAYCAVCDGAFYKGKNVTLIGGGNTGVEDALYLSKIANKVTLINKHEQLVAHQISVDELNHWAQEHGNVEIINNNMITKLIGEDKLQQLELTNVKTNEKQILDTDGLFVAIGRIPDTDFVKGLINLDKWGYVLTDEDMNTNLPGVFACGDVRAKKLRQIVTATSDGAIAATTANQYLNSIR